MSIDKETLEKHIKNAKLGHQAAFSFLMDTFWNQVYAFQLQRVKNETEAEEISVETFSKAFDKIHTFDENYTFSTWLITISKNTQIDYYRKKNSAKSFQTFDLNLQQARKIADETPSPEDKLIKQQNLAELLENIKKLKAHYQQMIQLRYFQEMSYKEMAEQLHEPINNIKVKLLRAKKLLAEIIQEKA